MCALPGTYTEKPKLVRAGPEGVACTPNAAVVGGVAVWVKAIVVGCSAVACVATPTPAAVVGSNGVWVKATAVGRRVVA